MEDCGVSGGSSLSNVIEVAHSQSLRLRPDKRQQRECARLRAEYFKFGNNDSSSLPKPPVEDQEQTASDTQIKYLETSLNIKRAGWPRSNIYWFQFSICAGHPCAGGMPIFSVAFRCSRMIPEGGPKCKCVSSIGPSTIVAR